MIEKLAYRGWPNSYRVTDGRVELIVTSDVGPRVMRFAFLDGQNLFYECTAQLGNTAEPWWMIRGGHRLWVAPETVPETYALDNRACEVTFPSDHAICVRAPIEEETKLRKALTARLVDSGQVLIEHSVTNCGAPPVPWAPWAVTVLAPGGTAFANLPDRKAHANELLPMTPLVLWAYTDLSDKRWLFTSNYVVLKQDPEAKFAQKVGLFNQSLCACYLLGSDLFCKQATASLGRPYPDFNSSFEIFSNRDFLELETLGPLSQLAPDETVIHRETWSLHSGVRIQEWTDAELNFVRSLIS